MNKLLMIVLLIVTIASCGCSFKNVGADLVEGAKEKVDEIVLRKNAALLSQAVTEGAALGLTYEQIDLNGDGLYDEVEAARFETAKLKAEFGGEVSSITNRLASGDFEGAKLEAQKASDKIKEAVIAAILSLLTAGGTYQYTMRTRNATREKDIAAAIKK